ncbi:MAG: BatA and WFA domain-containing protein [Planctomycetota bacterium]
MSFLGPAFLFGFALLAPLVAVYLLKVRPRRRPTTAMFLWEQVYTQKKANALLQRLRDVLSLLLLAAALVALVLAAARPRLDGGDPRDVLVLIDRSASMSADVSDDRPGTSRFDEAVDRAAGLLRSLGGQRRAAVATVDGSLRFPTLLTDEPRRLREALASVSPGEGPSVGETLADIRRVAGLGDDLRVVFLTDGVGLDAEDLGLDETQDKLAARPAIEVVLVGTEKDGRPGNLGLAAADLVIAPTGDRGTVLFEVVSSFDETVDAEVRLSLAGTGDDGGRPVKVVPLRVEPSGTGPRALGVEAGAGRYVLSVRRVDADGDTVRDALPLDDTAYLSVPEPRPLRVTVRTDDRFFFETAVSAFERTSGLLTLVGPDEPADVVIVRGPDGGPSVAASDAPLQIVFAPGGAPGIEAEAAADRLENVLPRAVLPDHPVLRFLAVESVAFAGARRVEAGPGSAVLAADVSGVPLIWQRRDAAAGTVSLVVNLDPTTGDFVLSPAFPVLVYAAAADLAGRDTPAAATYATGRPVPVPGLRVGETARVTMADGATLNVNETRPVAVLERAGFHRATTPSGAWDLPASVLHPAESTLRPPEGLARLPEVQLPGGYPPWAWLTLLALLVVAAEEALYHRRKVG